MVVLPSCAGSLDSPNCPIPVLPAATLACLVSVQALAGWRWARPGCLNPGSWQEGGGYVSMVTMGVEKIWGRVDLALWAPTLWLSCPCCFSACIEVSLTRGLALPMLGV